MPSKQKDLKVSIITLILFTSIIVFFLLRRITCTHPLILAIKILLLALSLCSRINLLTTWYAYIIFIVMLGGVLIIFTYISSLAPNRIFKVKWNTVHITAQLTILIFLTFNLINSYPKVFSTQKPDSLPDNLITFFLLERNSWLLLTIASALFLAMFIVTNLLSGARSAMRPTKSHSLSSKQENKIMYKEQKLNLCAKPNKEKSQRSTNNSLKIEITYIFRRSHSIWIIPSLCVTIKNSRIQTRQKSYNPQKTRK